ncbi:uncharacterized protein K441DRAFT_134151 [Cenococcum geophilum 1.58]|uniref:uncharacterized protein n=1 Tax=Cenococcum geophilum 1.58 TaxID=794803 RepID=UPI00358F268D|nr:hypothetical protein K441DRAFT_134151 [Cenococcum geophilum 1.58]
MSIEHQHEHQHEQSDDTMTIRVTPCSAALVSSQGASSCLRGAGCVNCHESFHRLSNNREDLVVMVNMEHPLSCPMLPQVTTVICYGVPSYREAAWRDGWWDNPRSHIAAAQHPKSCQSVVPVHWKDAQQGISGSISPGMAVVWSLSTIISHNGPTPA